MYAIIRTGSKQYNVKKGDVIDVELLGSDSKEVEFKEVLFINNGTASKVGTPHIENAVVKGELLADDIKGPKVISYNFKRRKNYHRKIGHRQHYSRVRIKDIVV